jgi:hypothetical protein
MPLPLLYRHAAVLAATAALSALAPMSAAAQGSDSVASASPRVTFGLGGGFAQNPPFYNLSPSSSTGYAARANLELRTPLPFLRLRGEGLFAAWSGGQRMSALTASAVAAPAVRWRAVPYLVGGGGGYALANGGGLRPGWTLGAGLRLPIGRQALMFETGMHVIDTGDRVAPPNLSPAPGRWQYTYTPLTIGWRF